MPGPWGPEQAADLLCAQTHFGAGEHALAEACAERLDAVRAKRARAKRERGDVAVRVCSLWVERKRRFCRT